MKELDALVAKLTAEENALTKQLQAIRARKQAVLSAFSPTEGKSQPAGKKPAKPKKRAPKGALGNAIKLALATTHNLGNKQIREAAIKAGYPYQLDATLVSKMLTRLVASKEIKMTETNGNRTYSLPTPAE